MEGNHNSLSNTKRQVAIIAGAGPAGLTAALELIRQTDIKPIILESSNSIGGLARTVNYNGNRIDIGGHRFFSKNPEITKWWLDILPLQGSEAKDHQHITLSSEGPNPEVDDKVMLLRKRLSRIFYRNRFFNYPISLSYSTLRNLGFGQCFLIVFGYLWACLHKLPEDSLENFYINRFGKPLYDLFFKDYTEKVWGVHPKQIDSVWGSQRVKGLSIMTLINDSIKSLLGIKTSENTETSLIDEFLYPKYGPGQLWETVAEAIISGGGEIYFNHSVSEVTIDIERVTNIIADTDDGSKRSFQCDYFISSMPIKDLVSSINGIVIPQIVRDISDILPYRDFITVGLCLKRTTEVSNIPDTWIYIQNADVKVGRLQIFNNWSPYMVSNYNDYLWLGLEFFCSEGDDFWKLPESGIIEIAKEELLKIGIFKCADIADSCCIKMKKAYPSYYGSYHGFGEVQKFLDGITNLFCIGRNGQHRYNNMDHSMLTAMECVKNIKNNHLTDKSNIWNVNTDSEYNERNSK